jgi:hypothetical protein
MTAKTEKIIPTREEVLALFNDKSRQTAASHPLTAGEIARYVSSEYPGSDWEDPYKNMHRTALIGLIREMADDGALVVRRGAEWREAGMTFYDQRNIVRYWTTPKLAEKWAQDRQGAEQADNERKHRQEADRYARELLVIRHGKEYDELIEDYHNGARLVDQEKAR